MQLKVVLEPSEDGGFTVYVPALPGCISEGETHENVNGLRLAGCSGARTDVVELFAYFHDSCRHNDNSDPEHGSRGAILAKSLLGTAFAIDPSGLALLVEACNGHTRGLLHDEPTVAT